ncbi:MAG: glycine dehydrogenase, partial [Dehalococcoidia bacterium]
MTLPYIANTEADRQAMLAAIGVASVEELFADIPSEFRTGELSLPPALSEPELVRELAALAERNQPVDSMPCFLGGGAYRHFIPSVVGEVIG